MPRAIAPGRSCLECRRRKIKCDRSRPCSYCVKVRLQCKYPARPLPNEDALTRVASLETKLGAMEKRLSGLTEPRQSTAGPAASGRRSHESRKAEHPLQSPPKNVSALLKPQPNIDIESLRPAAPMVAVLWQRYLDVVDPLIKIFHTPTVQKLVVKAIHGRTKLNRASHCLLFAIYYAAVAAMSREDCENELEEDRRVLLKRYGVAVTYCLSHQNLLECRNMTVLQAFSIYLITARCDEDGPDVYSLVGVAAGIALKMDLNKDGAALRLSPFETEMRRRLWWQLLILDTRVAEDRDSEPCILESSFNTQLPSNVADADLHPQMSRPPVSAQGRTEMFFSLTRFETSYFARQLVFSDEFSRDNEYAHMSGDQKRAAIDCFQDRIEKQYLSQRDDKIPLDNVLVKSVRLVLAKIKLMITDPTPMEDETEEEKLLKMQGWIEVLHEAEALRRYEEGTQWLWLFQTYIEWDALTELLLLLRIQTLGVSEQHAWNIAEAVYSYWKSVATTRHDHRWQRIERLRQEALALRDELLADT
ncbi:fungal-specific transcription factor domain-containing protein [Aspergillus karnatakaensis]|uniref:transcription factor domain-containing protein n=1 Tax=Aspergillus karnatakaensis TaxID=1810916 RepID=UPI003CCD958F